MCFLGCTRLFCTSSAKSCRLLCAGRWHQLLEVQLFVHERKARLDSDTPRKGHSLARRTQNHQRCQIHHGFFRGSINVLTLTQCFPFMYLHMLWPKYSRSLTWGYRTIQMCFRVCGRLQEVFSIIHRCFYAFELCSVLRGGTCAAMAEASYALFPRSFLSVW